MAEHLKLPIGFIFLVFILSSPAYGTVRDYYLVIDQQEVRVGDKQASGMTINGSIPGPTLYFKEGDLARIHVENRMDLSTSVHWHGLLVPPTMDGVPYITQVPIRPDTTFIYEFPIRQTGTYWYHSHSELQEQSGLYGSIVIADDTHRVDRDYVLLLSDWTTEPPASVLRTLKRGSHWYALEKGSSQSIFGAAVTGHLGDYFTRELQRMPPMDIADIAYDYFLSNGSLETRLEAKPGERIRLRVINGSATTYFHLNYSGGTMTIISADGQLVEPVQNDLFLIGVAETYDLLLDVPPGGSFEFRATAQDGSGFTSTWLGSGPPHPAQTIPKPNLYEPMEHGDMTAIFALTPAGTMGMPDTAVEAGMFDEPGMSHDMHDTMSGHSMPSKAHEEAHTDGTNENLHSMPMTHQAAQVKEAAGNAEQSVTDDDMGMSAQANTVVESKPKDHQSHAATSTETDDESPPQAMMSVEEQPGSARPYGSSFGLLVPDIASRPHLASEGGTERPHTPYPTLRSAVPSSLPTDAPFREIRLTLDGDMERYTWFINNKPISESDSILIREGEVVRFIMINRTMMHHPMHLHGHFFRVLNGQGGNAPLKHTVDVAPMSTTVIEFYGNEVGDWFFHCHLLYHMKSGMSRVIHYEQYKAPAEVAGVRHKIYKDPLYFYGMADILYSMTEGELTLANSRWDVSAAWEVGWQGVNETDWEGLFTADYHFNRFTSFFTGVDVEGEGSESEETRGVIGFSYLLPLNLEFGAWADTDGGGRFMFEKELELTPRLGLHGEVQYDTHEQWEGKVQLGYLINKEFSVLANWHSEYGFGVGLQVRF